MNVEEDLTPEQLENVHVHYVKSIPEVLELALPTTAREEKLDEEVREKVLSAQVSKPCLISGVCLNPQCQFPGMIWETGIFISNKLFIINILAYNRPAELIRPRGV